MSKEELLKQLEEKGLDFDTRALIVDDVLDIINRQLAEPKTENEKLKDIEQRKSFVLYSALCEVLEKRNVENVASMIDQLTKQDNGELCEMYKDYQNLKAENEKLQKRTLSEKEWQGYCAYKHIEKDLKGCLDREREYKQQLKEKDEEIAKWKQYSKDIQDHNVDYYKLKSQYDHLEQKLKSNTKQVCEKIREFIQNAREEQKYNYSEYYKGKDSAYFEIKELVDFIEKGEGYGER